MIRLALSSLSRHRGGYLGTFVATLLAIALLAGAGLLLCSVLTAKPPVDRFAAATLVLSGPRQVSVSTTSTKHKNAKHKKDKVKTKVKAERLTGAGTLPAGLANRLRTLRPVADVVPDVVPEIAFPVQVSTPNGRLLQAAQGAPVIGHGWASAALTPYTLRSGRPPNPGEVVLDADLARQAGDTVVITTRTGTRTFRVCGVAAPAGRDGLPAQGAIFLADADVAAVAGQSDPTAIAIIAAPGTDQAALVTAVRGMAGGAAVFTGDDRVRADLPGALPDYVGPISIFGFVLGLTGFAAVFVLTGTVTLGVRQRLRELALLRTLGATPRQVRRLLGVESGLLAGLAALGGAPLGIGFAEAVAARFRELGTVPAQFEVRVDVRILFAAAATGLLITFATARLAGRRAGRIAPTQALTETETETETTRAAGLMRSLIAAVTTAGAIALLTFVPLDGPFGLGMSFLSTALLLVAVAALGPRLVRWLSLPLSRILGAGGEIGRLAALVTRAQPRRVAAVAVPLVLMFAINAGLLLNTRLLVRLTDAEQTARTAPAMAQVSAPVGLPLSTARRLAATAGVTGAAITLPTRVIVEQGGKPQDYPAQGLLSTGTASALDLSVRDGAIGTGPDTFAASAYLTRQYRWRVGAVVPVWLADGHQVRLRLTAVYQRARGFGDLVLPAELVAGHDPAGLVGAVGLRYTGDVPARITAAFPSVQIRPTAGAAPPDDASTQQGGWELMIVISLAFTAIAVVNTSAIATTGRRREYAGLRLAGATTGQLHRLAGREAVLTVAAGLTLGAMVTGVVVAVFSLAQDGNLRVIVDVRTYLAMVGGVGALGLFAGLLPIRFVVRRRSLPNLEA